MSILRHRSSPILPFLLSSISVLDSFRRVLSDGVGAVNEADPVRGMKVLVRLVGSWGIVYQNSINEKSSVSERK